MQSVTYPFQIKIYIYIYIYPVFKREFKTILTISIEMRGKYQIGMPFTTDISPCSPPSAEPYH